MKTIPMLIHRAGVNSENREPYPELRINFRTEIVNGIEMVSIDDAMETMQAVGFGAFVRLSKLKEKMKNSNYYAEYDEESGMHCVFNTDDIGDKKAGFAFSSWADRISAENAAKKLNGE